MIVLETDNAVNQLMSESYRQVDRKTLLPELLWRCVELMACKAPEAAGDSLSAHPPPCLQEDCCPSQQPGELLWQLQPSPLLKGDPVVLPPCEELASSLRTVRWAWEESTFLRKT